MLDGKTSLPVVHIQLSKIGITRRLIADAAYSSLFFEEWPPCCWAVLLTLPGGDSRDRTGNLRLAKPALSQLSYIPGMVGLSGLEPLTSRLSGARSNHLSYRPPMIQRTSR